MSGPTSIRPPPRFALTASLLPAAPDAPIMTTPSVARAETAIAVARHPPPIRRLCSANVPLPNLVHRQARPRLRRSEGVDDAISREECQRLVTLTNPSAGCSQPPAEARLTRRAYGAAVLIRPAKRTQVCCRLRQQPPAKNKTDTSETTRATSGR